MREICLCLLFLCLPAQFAAADATVIKFSLGGRDIERNRYKIDLIKLILKNSDCDYNLLYYYQERGGGHDDQIEKLEQGIITIKTFGATTELENRLIPIRIPIFKGLLGCRVFLINRNDQYKFDRVTRLEDLGRLTGIQGKGWADIKILEEAGLHQIAVPGKALFRMLNQGGRTDYFSRALYEAVGELQTLEATYPQITLEKRILLTYPFAMFFYISPRFPELAKKFARSFQQLVANGRFDAFFYTNPYIRNAIGKVRPERRRRFRIPNRHLSPKARMLPHSYWFDLDHFREYNPTAPVSRNTPAQTTLRRPPDEDPFFTTDPALAHRRTK
ncbi:MAG: hypothetical protein GXO34_01270 [Deltaproteobacteria bacterium]|nr:hypothetical protein [Deltaproteobacteria bacterium]